MKIRPLLVSLMLVLVVALSMAVLSPPQAAASLHAHGLSR